MANVVRLVDGKLKAEQTAVTSAGAGDAGKLTELDGAGKLSTTVIPAAGMTFSKELHVNYQYTGSIENGAPLTPFKTLQAAVNAASSSTVIFLHLTGSATENITISAANNLFIQGVAGHVDSQQFELNGRITISGTSTRVRLKNFQITPTDENPAITVDGSSGRHYFERISCTGQGVTFTGTYSNWCEFRDCGIEGDISIAGTPVPGASVSFYNTLALTAAMTVNSPDVTVQMFGTKGLGSLTHTTGNLIINDFIGIGSAGITSTCNFGSGVFLMGNASMLTPAFSMATLNKSGTCLYVLGNVVRNEASDTVNGTRLFQGASSADMLFVPSTSGNWSSTPSSVKAGLDLLAADSAKGKFRIVTPSVDNYDLLLEDSKDTLIVMDRENPCSVVLPLNASIPIEIGRQVTIVGIGAGQLTIDGSAVTVITSMTNIARTVGSIVSAIKIATNTWLLTGDLEAP